MSCDIAIVGCAGRFPGAADVATLWENLCAGVESVSAFTNDELEDVFPPEVRARRDFVRARGVLDGVDEFDAPFFGMHAREAEITDPQHRVFLECCWQALEDAGHDPAAFSGAIGVFAGCSISTYLLRNVLAERSRVEQFTSDYQVGSYPELLGGGYDFLATRVAYKLDLRGPAMTLQSACSTSLLAVTQACQALMLGQADMMLAGGVSISFPQRRGYVYQDGGMVSADGHCRTFDAGASGTVFGAGAGVAVLRRLDDALRDGDSIYAVIRGFGVNNDGSDKVGYTAPSTRGQEVALQAAYAMARIEPHTVGLIECHGTATPLGDPIEFAALSRVYGSAANGPKSCALGSVKSNVGHLDVASGVTGLIKAALAVRTGVIPPTLHFTSPNPHIDLAASPFFVNTDIAQWPIDGATRRAAVSSFGLGGTNVHVVLESAPQVEPESGTVKPQLLVLSARSDAALSAACGNLAEHLGKSGARFEDVAYTLQTGRRAFPTRCALVASSPAEAQAALAKPERLIRGTAGGDEPVVGFLFPGQGAQYLGMGRDLYERAGPFTAAIDRCAEILHPLIGTDLRDLLYAQNDAERLTSTEIAQPAIFAVEYALAELLRAYGIVPAAAIGHSVGEFVAACLAGVFSLEDALAVVAERGRLIRALPAGVMLAVNAAERDLEPLLDGELDLAAVNAPNRTVVSGTDAAICRFEDRLSGANIGSRRLRTSHAFHSSMMEPALAPLAARIAAAGPRAPSMTPYVSSVTGTWIAEEEATSPDYWAQQCRKPVRFAAALQTMVDSGIDTLVEVGPGATLATLALQGAAKGNGARVIRTLPGSEQERPDLEVVLEALGRLWTLGAKPRWSALHAGAARTRVSLPTYPFERKRYWIEPPAAPAGTAELVTAPIVSTNGNPMQTHNAQPTEPQRVDESQTSRVQSELVSLLEDFSGESLEGASADASFLELGFDSLLLGRFAQAVQTRFHVELTFRQLLGELPSVAALAEYIIPQLPPQEVSVNVSVATSNGAVPVPEPAAARAMQNGEPSAIEALMRDQLQAMQQLMREQLQALQGLGHEAKLPDAKPLEAKATPQVEKKESEAPSRMEAFRIVGAPKAELTPAQRGHIDDLIARTVARTAESKRLTQQYRAVLADPRVAAGFRSEWKEMVYPLTCVRAKGSRLWDADGNEYIDLLNGFGQTAFGHAPDFVVEAVTEQLQRGFAIGPQTELACEAAELFCELTGNERVTFCNTGSEAVMAALRVARTVTGRSRVVMFEGSYHGQFDEVLVKSARSSRRSLPVALGIPDEAVANITVLPYGTPESLEYVREHANDLAAVIVESVQSRHPALRPKEFLAEIRAITQTSGTAFIFDEVVTGFRMHPGGMQAVFDVRADLATYGKVVGGGLPIGILAGTSRFMDALDGGMWQYGDDSSPQVAPTFVAGTFVRHPLVMAAVLAVLRHLKAQGPALQEAIGQRTQGLVARLNAELEAHGIATRIETYGSLFYLNFAGEDRLAGLLFYHLRLRGIYVQEGFPSFLTTEHTDADVDTIVEAFVQSLDELQTVGILTSGVVPAQPVNVALTEEQTEIWLSAQVSDEASCAFNESVTLRLPGSLDESVLQRALDRIVARHDALRASFGSTGESMHIAASAPFTLVRRDLAGIEPSAREQALREIVEAEAGTPFDLAAGPLARGTLVRLDENEHALIFTAHHIICDGWSMNVILSELADIYTAYSRNEEPKLPEPLAFATYAQRQAQRDPAETAKVQAYWLEQFREVPALLELPTDRPRPSVKTYEGATRTMLVDRDAYRAIKQSGAKHGCTLFVTLLAAFDVLAGRLADQDDVVVGIPAAGQSLLDDETLVGHCVDFLPIRSRLSGASTIADFLGDVKRRVLDAYEHQQSTLGTIVRALTLPREAGRIPLAEIQFNLERLADNLHLGSLEASVQPNPKAFVNFDIFLNAVESEDGLRIDCDYNTNLFDASTIDRWLTYYRGILDEVVRDSSQTIGSVNFLSERERAVLAELNDTKADYPKQTLHELIAATAAARGDAPAVRFGNELETYATLQRRVNQTANYLLGRIGQPGHRIAVCVERSQELIVALLATLAAGCSYVPLDPAHPPARLKRILEDAGVVALICDGSSDRSMIPSGVETIDLRETADAIAAASTAKPETPVSPEDAAYVIYTSGSTGEPKGVEIAHASVVNLLSSMAQRPGLQSSDVLLAVTTVSFDIAGLELFLPLLVGATVAIASSEDLAEGDALVNRLTQSGATVMQATPALWNVLLDSGFRSRAGFTMLCGGEALSRELADRLLAGGGELWNVYGPTETTIWSSCAKIEPSDDAITVGTPIANTQFYVLDRNDRPVAVGVAGHLHIGGDGVARGYVGRPELTAEKFVANPFGGGRMYRTGDLARVTAGGQVQIVGRLDDQIKLRGFRIELGEVESTIRAKTNLTEVAVVVHEDAPGDRRLVCYYVVAPNAYYDPASLHTLLAETLPDYMIPAAWMSLERMPLSVAGKVDRKALPAPQFEADPSVFRAPATPTEITLAGIWTDVLHVERIGLDDDFFSLGGDSIHLFQITARANQSGLPLKAKELLRRPTLGALAAYLAESTAESNDRRAEIPAAVAHLRANDKAHEGDGAEYRERTAR